MTKETSTNSPDAPLPREISPFDSEAEPEDLAAMEQELSETTEDGCCDMPLEEYDPIYAEGIRQEGALCEEELVDLELLDPDMQEEHDRLAAETVLLALAEPEPLEKDDTNGK